jgi:hypothetical protein
MTDYTKLEQIVESNSDVILDMAAIKPSFKQLTFSLPLPWIS